MSGIQRAINQLSNELHFLNIRRGTWEYRPSNNIDRFLYVVKFFYLAETQISLTKSRGHILKIKSPN